MSEIANMEICVNFALKGYTPLLEVINEVPHYVVPVVMMVEGVHNGSGGRTFHSSQELSNSVELWQNAPVTIHHPVIGDEFVSVHEDGIEEQYVVGYVSEAVMKDNKLTATLKLNCEKLNQLSPETVQAIQNGNIMEVSIGVFTDTEEKEGEWNGETYERIAHNHRPDHLALLPGEVGACSVKDGCGLRVNNNKKEGGTNVDVVTVNSEMLKHLNKEGFAVVPITINQEGFSAIMNRIYNMLNSMDTQGVYYYLEEAYDGYLVYNKRTEDGKSELYKQTYQTNADGTIELTGEPVKVTRKIEYIQVNNEKEEEMCEPCKERVNELIAHESTHFDETDREWLEALTEDKLDKLVPKNMQVNVTVPSVEDAVKVIQTNAKGLDDYLNVLPENVRAEVNLGLATFKERKDALIASIQANTEKDTWSEDELNVMSLNTLQKLEKSVIKKGEMHDYSVNGLRGATTEKGKIEPLMLPIQ